MIHKFCQDNIYMVIDVNSGAVHVIDELVYDVLDFYQDKETGKLWICLKIKYSGEEMSGGY